MAMPAPGDLVADALTWDGLTIGGVDADVYLGDGIEGLAHPGVSPNGTPLPMGGTLGGVSYPGQRTVTASAWLRAKAPDSKLWPLYLAMGERPHPDDELQLAWRGLMWPGEHCVFARPTKCDWLTDEEGTHGGAPGLDLQWVASDPTAYSYEQHIQIIPTDDPQWGVTFPVPNDGRLVPWARRAWEFRMTAHGPLVNPRIRVDHADGTFEQITLQGLTMTGGQVLTFGADRQFRVQGRNVGGRCRSLTQLGKVSRSRRLWNLQPSTGDDGGNVVTMDAQSGQFSGFCKTRSTL